MKTKTTKTLTVALGIFAMSLTAGVVFSLGRDNVSTLMSKADQTVSGSFTWTSEDLDTQHTQSDYSRTYISYSSNNRGTGVYMFSNSEDSLSDDDVFSAKLSGSEENDYCLKFVTSNAYNPSTPFYFQHITNITVTTTTNSVGFAIYRFSDKENPIYTSGSTIADTAYLTGDLEGIHSVVIRPVSAMQPLTIKSVTISYSCDPSNDLSGYSIEYTGLEHVLETSTLPSYGAVGEKVEIIVITDPEFEFADVSIEIEDYTFWETLNVVPGYGVTFIMPSCALNIELMFNQL